MRMQFACVVLFLASDTVLAQAIDAEMVQRVLNDQDRLVQQRIQWQQKQLELLESQLNLLKQTASGVAPMELQAEYGVFVKRAADLKKGKTKVTVTPRALMLKDIQDTITRFGAVVENRKMEQPVLDLTKKHLEPGSFGFLKNTVVTIERSEGLTKFHATIGRDEPRPLFVDGWNYTEMPKEKVERYRDQNREPTRVRVSIEGLVERRTELDAFREKNGVRLDGAAVIAGTKPIKDAFGSSPGEIVSVPIVKKLDAQALHAALTKAREDRKNADNEVDKVAVEIRERVAEIRKQIAKEQNAEQDAAAEKKASSSLKLAKKYIADGNSKLARKTLETIIKQYPETDAKREAEELLKGLSD